MLLSLSLCCIHQYLKAGCMTTSVLQAQEAADNSGNVLEGLGKDIKENLGMAGKSAGEPGGLFASGSCVGVYQTTLLLCRRGCQPGQPQERRRQDQGELGPWCGLLEVSASVHSSHD